MITKLSKTEFDEIFSKVPRVTVEVICITEKGVLLTLRAFGQWKGQWHTPGGGILKGESMVETVKRVASEELGVEVKVGEFLGVIEWLPENNNNYQGYSLCFKVALKSEDIKLDKQALDWDFFKKIPEKTIKEHKEFLIRFLDLKEQ